MNKPTLIVSLLIVAGTLILMGANYAYFTAIANSEEQVVQSGVLELTYLTGQDITLEGIFPSEETEAVLDNIQSIYVTSPTGIDFSQISSDTNGKGLYTLHGTESNTNPIMYYRGAVENNNVKFANFCWKIVRTTETGGVKLIYNGEPNASGQCIAKGRSTVLSDSAFNESRNDNAFVGYMYGETGSSTYEETHRNTNDSTIKTVIDTW